MAWLAFVALSLGVPTQSGAISPAGSCDGTWQVQPSENPGTWANELNGVAMVTATDGWVVGYKYPNIGDGRALIERWD